MKDEILSVHGVVQGQEIWQALMSFFYIIGIISLVVMVINLVAMWRIFRKAGYAGWKCLIPIYNSYLLCEIAFGVGNGLLFLVQLIPFVGGIFTLVQEYMLCKSFNKSTAFAVLAIFFTPITRCILAFDGSQHVRKTW